MGEDAFSLLSFNVEGGGQAEREEVSAVHPGFSRAWKVTVKRPSARPHQLQLAAVNHETVEKGDVVRVSFALRSGGAGDVKVDFFVLNAVTGYKPITSLKTEAGVEWKEYAVQFEAPEKFFKNELRFSLFVGLQSQVVELGGFRVVNLGPKPDAVTLRAQAASRVEQEHFEQPFEALTEVVGSGFRISGALPKGWADDSAWSRSTVAYSALTQGPFAGVQSLRMAADQILAGRAHLIRPVFASASHYLRLSVALRSPTSATLRVQVRQRGAPFTVYGETLLNPIPEWGVFEAVLPPAPRDDRDAILIFALETPGVLEIDDFCLMWLTAEAALSEVDTSGNLLGASSWPLGLTYPWFQGGNERPDGSIVVDPEEIGPTGQPALRLTPHPWENRVIAQITSPFVGRPGSPHTFSFWAKAATGGRPLSIRMGPPGEPLFRAPWEKTVTLSTEWRRYSFTTVLPVSSEGFYLARINTHDRGVFWVDGAQVVVGEDAGEFRRTGAVEVAVRPTEAFGLYLEGQPLALEAAVWGEMTKFAELRGRLVDTQGRAHELSAVSVSALRDGRGRIEIPLGSEPPLGSYVAIFTAHGPDGVTISKPTEVILHRVRPARFADRLAPESFFGTHAMVTEAAVMKRLGFNWLRPLYFATWSAVEPRPGQWNFDKLDWRFRQLSDAKMAVLIPLGGVPRWASFASDSWTGSNPGWWRVTAAPRPEFMDQWQAYAREMMTRYGGVVQAWETWNEPFLPGFFPGGRA